jgi:hypothetical protein
MKKIGLLFVLLTSAASAVFYCTDRHFSAPSSQSAYYAHYLPADTLAVFSFLDLKGLSRSFPNSALGRFFSKAAMRGIMAEQGAAEEAVQQYEEFHDGAADLLTNPFLQHLFGDDLTFALLNPDPAALRRNPEEELRRRLLGFGTSASGWIVDSIARLTMSGDFSRETVNGLKLTRIRLDDDEPLYAHVQDGVIILAFRPELIAAALRRKERGSGLAEQPWFRSGQQFWAAAETDQCHARFSCNLSLLPVLAKRRAALLQGLSSLSGFAAAHQGDVLLRSKLEVGNLPETLRHQRRSARNLSLPLLTDKTLFHVWTAGLDQHLFASLAPVFYERADQAAQQHLGLTLQEIMTAVGPQAGLMINGVATAGFFPLPKLALFAQTAQPEAARQLMDRLRQRVTAQGIAEERVTEAAGHAVYYWNLLPAEAAHPAVALSSRMLYIANGESALRMLLEQERQAGLPQSVRSLLGQELAVQFAQADYAALFARPALLAAEAEKADVWLNAALGRSKEKLRTELLKLMESVDLAVSYGSLTEDQADFTLLLRPAALRKTPPQE